MSSKDTSSSKLLLANYPSIHGEAIFSNINNAKDMIRIFSGYDLQVDNISVTLQIASDLINAILDYDSVYLFGSNIADIAMVFGTENLKLLLSNKILKIIPDQDLNPVLMKQGCEEWRHDCFPYASHDASIFPSADNKEPSKWDYIELWFRRHNFIGEEADRILNLIDDNSVDVGNPKEIIDKINHETDLDINNPDFRNNPEFFRYNINGSLEYNIIGRLRMESLNKTNVISGILDINNIKAESSIEDILFTKSHYALSKDIRNGVDAIRKIEYQKGFPDFGKLFYSQAISLTDILKLRDSLQGKLFRIWAKNDSYDEDEMRKDVMASVSNVLGSNIAKLIRFSICNITSLISPLAGTLSSVFDSFLIDKLVEGWHPNLFLDGKLKKLIDKCENDHQQDSWKVDYSFSKVGRNDPCPCGSGLKFKYCHGKIKS